MIDMHAANGSERERERERKREREWLARRRLEIFLHRSVGRLNGWAAINKLQARVTSNEPRNDKVEDQLEQYFLALAARSASPFPSRLVRPLLVDRIVAS